MPQVFVSHCTQDAEFAQRIARALRASGVDVWIAPDSIHPGETFVDAIERGLGSTTHFVIVMSPDAVESNWVKLELNTAIRLERDGQLEISPILYRECRAPLLLGNFQWLTYDGSDRGVVQQLLRWVGVQGAARQGWSAPRAMGEEQLVAAQAELLEIANEVAICRLCPLYRDRLNTVPGEGAPNASLMFIGVAPGPEDNASGRPFVSAAGEFLGELLDLIRVRREDVFMTNAVKCRPDQQRDPSPDEIQTCCDNYLDRQIAAVDPPVIVTLGAHALTRLAPGVKLSTSHGKPQQIGGRTLFPMYHPAAALYQVRYRKMLTEDFVAMERYLASREPA